MWRFGGKGESGFCAGNTAEQVTDGIDGSALTAIITGLYRASPVGFTILFTTTFGATGIEWTVVNLF